MMNDTNLASYADDNTPYVSADTIDEVIKRLETASVKLFKWFADNQMKANQDKCHLIVSKNENISMHSGPFEIKNTNCEKLLVLYHLKALYVFRKSNVLFIVRSVDLY